ncbi:MAG: hypothetical protein WDZ72_15000, partial [Cyclobacteriaceae bacterium]
VEKESLPKIIDKVDPIPLKEWNYSSLNDGEVTLEFEDFLQITYTKGKVSREFNNSFVPGKAPKFTISGFEFKANSSSVDIPYRFGGQSTFPIPRRVLELEENG